MGKITKLAEEILDKYATIKINVKNTISSYNTHNKNLKYLIHNLFGSPQSFENKIKKLNEHGISGKDITNILDEEAEVRSLEDPEVKKIVKL